MKDVHTEHCQYDRCKYGEEHTCTVYQGYVPPTYPDKSVQKPTQLQFQQRRRESDSALGFD